MAKDALKITLLCVCCLGVLIVFLAFADAFISAMSDPSACEGRAKTIRELALCP